MNISVMVTSTALALGLLSACAQTSNSLTQIQHADERVVAYFHENGDYSQTKTKNGYERKLFGTTSAQHWVLQDFYAINGQPQTSPFAMIDERGLYDWDTLKFTTGKVTFYYADGKKQSTIQMNNGLPIGEREVFYRSGEVFLRQQFDEQGQLRQERFFETNGKPMMVLRFIADQAPVVWAFDATGKQYELSDSSRELFLTITNRIVAIQSQLRHDAAVLAGQTPPPLAPAD